MAQTLVVFSLEALQQLDGGKASIAFRRSVEDAVRDMQDRPMDKTARTVTLKLTMKPISEEDPEFENSYRLGGTEADFQIVTSLPKRKTKPYSFGVDRNGKMYFSRNSPENVNQTTIDDIDPATGKAVRSEVREVQPEEG